MAVKCIGLGNRLMGDDAVGIAVLETLAYKLRAVGITVIFGETDAYYALSQIEDGDLLFVLDAALQRNPIGTVSFIPLEQLLPTSTELYHQHEESLFHLIIRHRSYVSGFTIAIEAEAPVFNMEISAELAAHIPRIADESLNFILEKAKEYHHA